MIKSNKVLYSAGNNDERYTPEYGVLPVIRHLMNRFLLGSTVWCPFDKPHSNFVQLISRAGYKVISSHIEDGKDFYTFEPENWDVIISNPPFSGKRQIFERALSFNKPFALLMSNTWLNDSAPNQLFREKDLQLLMFDKRIKYTKPDGTSDSKITFSSSYFCWDFLSKQIIMESLKKEKSL